MRHFNRKTLVISISYIFLVAYSSFAERLIDSVIATVDDKPITLLELGKRLSPVRQVTIKDLQADDAVKKALDGLILEKLLVAEAERKNIRISDEDITRYVEEVKQRNQLSDSAFEDALRKENQTLATYKDRVKSEILKSRVATASIKSTAAVTDEEVTQFIKQKLSGESIHASGQKVHLRRILLSSSKYSAEDARKKSEDIKLEILDGSEFAEIAKSVSDATDAINGGDLGIVPSNDLSPEIIDAVKPLKANELSHLVTTPDGFEIFQLIERIDSSESDSSDEDEELKKKVEAVPDDIRAQIKQKLEAEKMEKKMISFIDIELPKLHTIEKKF
jgi:peptidyl-prolyl cis-trans isomerase SurA